MYAPEFCNYMIFLPNVPYLTNSSCRNSVSVTLSTSSSELLGKATRYDVQRQRLGGPTQSEVVSLSLIFIPAESNLPYCKLASI